MATRVIPINAIEVPKKWRPVKKKKVAELVLTLRKTACCTPSACGPPREARQVTCSSSAGIASKPPRRPGGPRSSEGDGHQDEGGGGRHDAENLFRNNLNAAERVIALKAGPSSTSAEHPEVHGRGKAGGAARQAKAVEKGTGKAPELPKTFPSTSASRPASRRDHQEHPRDRPESQRRGGGRHGRARGALGAHPQDQQAAGEQRKEAVALVAAGQGPARRRPGVAARQRDHRDRSGDPEQGAKAEADMTDDEWLETLLRRGPGPAQVQGRVRRRRAPVPQDPGRPHKLKTGRRRPCRRARRRWSDPSSSWSPSSSTPTTLALEPLRAVRRHRPERRQGQVRFLQRARLQHQMRGRTP
jgi:hypothetical protein